MRPVETIPGMGGGEEIIKENDGGSEFKYDIVRTFVSHCTLSTTTTTTKRPTQKWKPSVLKLMGSSKNSSRREAHSDKYLHSEEVRSQINNLT
jgi:hypothetical protein